jgi:hypothetical protein
MNVYDVGNKSRRGFWVAANTEAEAKQIAMTAGHAKTIAHLHATDISVNFTGKGAPEILSGTRTGHLAFKGVKLTFAEVINGTKREAEGWFFV